MFKETEEGQTQYCPRCEVEARKCDTTGFKHTCGKTSPLNQAPESKEWEEGDPKPDITQVKCSCGQYYARLDHCCYPWVGDFNRECGFIFSGSLGQLQKEKIKDFLQTQISKARSEAQRDTIKDLESILGYCGTWSDTDIIEVRKRDGRSTSMRIDVFIKSLTSSK